MTSCKIAADCLSGRDAQSNYSAHIHSCIITDRDTVPDHAARTDPYIFTDHNTPLDAGMRYDLSESADLVAVSDLYQGVDPDMILDNGIVPRVNSLVYI